MLAKWLKKKGIKDFYEMSPEEKETYQKFERVLKGKALTDEDVKAFWEEELEEINKKLTAEDLTDRARDFLLVELRVVRKIKGFLETPEKNARDARIMIEQQVAD